LALATFAKPIIGAINGIAYGAGAQLTTMLDIRIGCENTEIQFLAAKYGRANSTWSLPLVVGLPKAKELLYTGRPIRAEEAERIGLLNQVVPSEELLAVSIAMAKLISENDPRMVQGIKMLLDDGVGSHYRERFDAEHTRAKANESQLAARRFQSIFGTKGNPIDVAAAFLSVIPRTREFW
jgi:enoyl-CoA hydratase/carnithine racemase